MSRFFTKSDSESESSASEDEIVVKPAPNRTFVQSDDDEDTKRVVKSSREKKYEELQTIIKNLKNHKKIKDMSNVLNDFEELGKAREKAKKVIDKDGLPRFFIKCLVDLEDFVNSQWENTEARKALNKNNSKGLTALRQKLKKYNKSFEDKINHYRENPDQSDQEMEKEEKSGDEKESDDEDVVLTKVIKPEVTEEVKKKQQLQQQDSDSDDMWGQQDSSSEGSDDDIRPINQLNADYFRKKVTIEGEGEGRKKKEEKKRKAVRKVEEETDDEEPGEWEKVGSSAVAEKPEIFGKDVEINHEVVKRKLIELSAGRGRKGTDRSMQVDMLIELRKIAKDHSLGEAMDCKILMSIVAAIFDYNPSIASSMKAEVWERCLKYISELLSILNDNVDSIKVGDHIPEESENYIDITAPYRIRGCMLTVVERMDEEFKLMLQACDAHSTDYVERLKDEKTVCEIIEDLEKYMEGHGTDEELCRLYLKRIQHLYYKFDAKSYGTTKADVKSAQAVMDRLCRFIYTRDSTDRIRILAILSHIYHHAIHDRYYEARDLLLMSHLQDDMALPRVPIQIKILYNRTTVQLGFCAFRMGLIKDAHNYLVEIQSSRRARELLAQGLLPQRQHDRTPEQEKKEKRQQVPYHMHINLELLECIYLLCAMLIEIPNMAAHEFEGRRKMISKNFHHVLREHDKQNLVGHPESMREHMVAAFKAMKSGEWSECYNLIVNDKLNAKVWSLFSKYGDIKEMIKAKVKEETLRTYLFTYSSIFESNQLDLLAEMFELPLSTVNSIVSKMIINDDLMALIDEPSQCLEMHQREHSVAQSLALQLSDKLSQIVEQNERLLSIKVDGPNFFSYPQRTGGPNQGGYQQNQGYQQRGNQGRNQQQNYSGRRQNQRGKGQNSGYQQNQSQSYQGRRVN